MPSGGARQGQEPLYEYGSRFAVDAEAPGR